MMTEIEARDGAKYGERSPVPRRQLASLPANQRSYSRMSSKGLVFGDDSPLNSPIPPYPRRRSVTFAIDRKVYYREERPEYHTTYSASAPVSPIRERAVSPAPMSILKQHSSYGDDENNNEYYYNDKNRQEEQQYRATKNEAKGIDHKAIGDDYHDNSVNSNHTDHASTAAGLTDKNNNNNNNNNNATRSVSGGNTNFLARHAYTDANTKREGHPNDYDNINSTHKVETFVNEFDNSSSASAPLSFINPREGKYTSVMAKSATTSSLTKPKNYTREAVEHSANKENELPTHANMYSSSSSSVHQSHNFDRSHDHTNHSQLQVRSSRRVSPVVATSTSSTTLTSTRRGRSASRQRLAQRRREAELQHSFYDDSFVEEFVLSTKAELYREEELKRLEEQQRASVLAEAELKRQRAEEEKLTAVEKAKRILTSKVQRRSFSVTPPRTDISILALQSQATSHNHRKEQHEEQQLLEENDNNNDKDNAENTLESSILSNSRKKKRHLSRGNTCTDDTHTNTKHMYNVHQDENNSITDDNEEYNESAETSLTRKGHKRRKLEKIVNQLLQRQRQSQSKRSVVVIDWEDVNSSSLASETFDSDDDNENNNSSRINESDNNQNKQTNVLRQASVTQTAQSNQHHMSAEYNDNMGKRLNRIESERRHRSHSRSVVNENVPLSCNTHNVTRAKTTSHQRHQSIVPDLADDSALYDAINVNEDEDRPILLPRRRQQRQLIPTRSLSQLAKHTNNNEVEELEEEYDHEYSRRNNNNVSLTNVKKKNKHFNTIYSRHDDVGGKRKNVIFETDEDKERIMRQPPKITRSTHRSQLPVKAHRDDLNVSEAEDNDNVTNYKNKPKNIKKNNNYVDSNKNSSLSKFRLTKKGPVASDLFAPHRQGANAQGQSNGRSVKNYGEQESYEEEQEYQPERENNDEEIDDQEIGPADQYNNNSINNISSQSNDNISNRIEIEGDNLLFGNNSTFQRGRRAPRTAGRYNTTRVNTDNHNNHEDQDDDNDDDPMAVFFNAAFPSPSKFDEMVMQAGGLPETRHTSRRQRGGHQPSLILPSSISRRR